MTLLTLRASAQRRPLLGSSLLHSLGGRIPALGLAVTLAGCSGETGEISPSPSVDVPEGISLSTSALEFGLLEAHDQKSLSLTVSNDSDAAEALTLLIPEGPFTVAEEGVISLEPHSERQVTVTFSPGADMDASTELVLLSSGSQAETWTVSLTGQCEAPRLGLPLTETYPTALEQCTLSQSILLKNTGRRPLIVDSVTLEDVQGGTFALAESPASPLTLEPEASQSLDVVLIPDGPGQPTASLTVTSNDPEGTRSTALSATIQPSVVDSVTFYAYSRRPLDFLLVVDNSGSMCDEQLTLQNNLSDFMAIIDSKSVPYHIGVIDVENPALNGDPRYITPETPDKEAVFLNAAYVGCDGKQSTEMGLMVSTQALTLEAVENPGDYFRPEALLRVLYISDENDQSPDTVANYVKKIQSYKLDPADVQLSAIAGDPGTGCSSNTSYAVDGSRYYEATQLTGGSFQSICSSDYVTILNDMAWGSVVEQVDKYMLPSWPEESSIQVWIDGQSIPKNESYGWTYDASIRGLVLHGSAIPLDEAKIDVTYFLDAPCP